MKDDEKKAECFNEYFAGIGANLAKEHVPVNEKEVTRFITKVTPTISEISINQEMVRKSIAKKLKPNKAMGPDEISPKTLHLLGSTIDSGLYYIFRKSIQSSKCPMGWKISCLSPLFKKWSSTERANFRPISLLSVPSKLLEDVVCHSLDDHVNSHKLSSNRQWGFKEGHSTEGMLLHLTEKWRKALDNGYKVGVIFLDFRKAFDTVNHEILLQKLESVGIFGSLFSWLKDYLQNRKQYTKVNGKVSSKQEIRYGVPQGSVLGPRLYSLYVNDLPDSVMNGELYMFAADTTIFTAGSSVDEVCIALPDVMNEVYKWCSLNQLTVHEGKTEAVILKWKEFHRSTSANNCWQ